MLEMFFQNRKFSYRAKVEMSSRMSKADKEKEKIVQEKVQRLLTAMLKDEDNKYCADCDSKGPRWASWNLGVFLCIRCAGIHRNLGVHISKVKSVNLDSWTPQQVAVSKYRLIGAILLLVIQTQLCKTVSQRQTIKLVSHSYLAEHAADGEQPGKGGVRGGHSGRLPAAAV